MRGSDTTGPNETVPPAEEESPSCRDDHLERSSASEFFDSYSATIAEEDSDRFVRLTDAEVRRHFEKTLAALLVDDAGSARCEVEQLEGLGVRYRLEEVVAPFDRGSVYGLREAVPVTDPDYRGWGMVLVRPSADSGRVYQAPHPTADWFSERIALDGFLTDPDASIALFAGTHRNANGDTDGDGERDSDVTHDTENLFHVLTEFLAREQAADASAVWFIQIHGAKDRDGPPDGSEPSIVGSDGADRPVLSDTSPLVRIDSAVANGKGPLSMGVCGWDEGDPAVDEKGNVVEVTGDYTLCATGNVQGDLLEAVGLRRMFMHFEIERSARDEYSAGVGVGYDGIIELLDAIERHAHR